MQVLMVSLYIVSLITLRNNVRVIKIQEKYDTQENSFSFTLFSEGDILKAIKFLSSNKASPIEDIPIEILKN